MANRKDRRVNKAFETINSQLGHVPPQAIEVEEAVLGALILERDAYREVEEYLDEDSFYKEEHRVVFNAIKRIIDREENVDMIMVMQELKNHNELTTVPSLTPFTSNVASAAHIVQHAKILYQKQLRRNLIKFGTEIVEDCFNETNDIDDVLTENVVALGEMNNIPMDGIATLREIGERVYEKIKDNMANGITHTGIPYGIFELDAITKGIQYTDLTFIAAEPSMGKTSLMISIINNLIQVNVLSSIISMEMSSEQLFYRLMSQHIGVPSSDIAANLDSKQIGMYEHFMDTIDFDKAYVDQKSIHELSSMLAHIRMMHKKFGVRIFFIDYLQLIGLSAHTGTEEGKLATISRQLKNLAKELDIAIIVLSQLNREKNKSLRPTMDRLRGSGQIAEAADNVIFIHRPEAHGIETLDDDVTPSTAMAEIIVGKGRNTGTGKLYCNFEKSTGLFSDRERTINYDSNAFPPPDNPDRFHESGSQDKPF